MCVYICYNINIHCAHICTQSNIFEHIFARKWKNDSHYFSWLRYSFFNSYNFVVPPWTISVQVLGNSVSGHITGQIPNLSRFFFPLCSIFWGHVNHGQSFSILIISRYIFHWRGKIT